MGASQRHKCEIHRKSSIGTCPPYGGAGGSFLPVWSPIVVPQLTQDAAMTPLNLEDFVDEPADATFAVTAGALPTGLSLSSAGVLSGTPTLVENQTGIVVTATYADGSVASPAFAIDVAAP